MSDPHPANRSAALTDRLRRALATLGPEGRLAPERTLAAQMGVGRGRLRAALATLEAEGIVFRRQGQGTFAAPSPPAGHQGLRGIATAISPADVMEVRRQIEPALAGLAALRAADADMAGLRDLAARCRAAPDARAYERADEIFHHRIAELARNLLFLRVYEEIRAVRQMTRWHAERAGHLDAGQIRERSDEHDAIVAALATADPVAAARTMDDHLARVERRMGAAERPPFARDA